MKDQGCLDKCGMSDVYERKFVNNHTIISATHLDTPVYGLYWISWNFFHVFQVSH